MRGVVVGVVTKQVAMTRRWVTVAVAAVCVLAAAGCVPPYTGAPGAKVALVGDSITDWTEAELRARLETTYAVSISGTGGTTIAENLAKVQEYADTAPEVVIIQLGANDVWRATEASPSAPLPVEVRDASLASSSADLGRLLAAVPSARCVVVVNVGTDVFDVAYRDWATTWDRITLPARAATDPRVHLADWDGVMQAYRAAGSPGGDLTTDTVHPTAVGRELLADLVGDTVDRCLTPTSPA